MFKQKQLLQFDDVSSSVISSLRWRLGKLTYLNFFSKSSQENWEPRVLTIKNVIMMPLDSSLLTVKIKTWEVTKFIVKEI